MDILITGVSSGIGRALTKKLVGKGDVVWGVARREELLKTLKHELGNSSKFIYTVMDVANKSDWQKLVSLMKRKKFLPQTIIFNAAINERDLLNGINLGKLEKIFNINFWGVMWGVEQLIKVVKTGTQFIAISSLSALKGSSIEGIGYPSSKAALSIAFESLHQRYKGKYYFKTVYFGPIASGMGPFKKSLPVILSEDQAINSIIKTMNSHQIIHYSPWVILFVFRIIKIFPPAFYFFTLYQVERFHLKFGRKRETVLR